MSVPEKFSFEKGASRVLISCMQNLAAISSLTHACKISPQSRMQNLAAISLGVVALFVKFSMNFTCVVVRVLHGFFLVSAEFQKFFRFFFETHTKKNLKSLPAFHASSSRRRPLRARARREISDLGRLILLRFHARLQSTRYRHARTQQ